MKKNLCKVLMGSFVRGSRLIYTVFLVSALCAIVLASFSGAFYSDWRKGVESAKETYGDFQFGFQELDRKTAEELAKTSGVHKSALYWEAQSPSSQQVIFEAYTEEAYLELSNVQLVSGSFPKGDDEILCEKWYLYQLGMKEEEMIGSTIQLEGRSYRVSGLILDHRTANVENVAIFNFVHPLSALGQKAGKWYGVVMKTDKESFHGTAAQILRSHPELKEQYYENVKMLTNAKLNAFGLPDGMEFQLIAFVYLLILLLSASLLCTIASLLRRRLNRVTSVYVTLGIPKGKVLGAYGATTFLFSLGGMMAGFGAAAVLLRLLWPAVSLLPMLALYVPVAAGLPLFLSCYSMLSLSAHSKASHARLTNTKEVRQRSGQRKSVLASKKNLYVSLARVGLGTTKIRTALFVSVMCVGLVLFNLVAFFLVSFYHLNHFVDGFDYKVEFSAQNYEELYAADDTYSKIYKDMERQDDFVVYPAFYQEMTLMLPKETIPPAARNQMEKRAPDIRSGFQNPSLQSLQTPVLLIGVRAGQEGTLYQLSPEAGQSMKEGSCVVSQSLNARDGGKLEWRHGDRLSIPMHSAGEEKGEWRIAAAQKIPPVAFDGAEYLPVVFVNETDYQKIVGKERPEFTYLKKTAGGDEKAEDYFRGNSKVKLIDLKEENAFLQTKFQFLGAVLLGVFAVLSLMLAANIAVTVFSRYDSSKGEYAALQAIGIGKDKILRVFLYEMSILLLLSLAVGLVLSLAGCYGVYCYIVKLFHYFTFHPPWLLLAGSGLFMVAISLLLVLPVFQKIKRETMLADLAQSE